jgi:AraC family transcriptional regulator
MGSQACSTLRPMADRPNPGFRTRDEVLLVGTMAIYDSQDEATERIPQQWRDFLRRHPALGSSSDYYGASPCTSDRKLHYLTGVAQQRPESAIDGERLRLEAGEYAVVRLNDAALLRDTWIWLLRHWLPNSGFREKNAPEFERFTGISEAGTPIGPVEIWIPLESAGIEDL